MELFHIKVSINDGQIEILKKITNFNALMLYEFWLIIKIWITDELF